MSATLEDALSSVPTGLRDPLIEQFDSLVQEYRTGDWEKVGLKAGKLCEIVYSILAGHVAGSFPGSPSKPANMVDACKKLESAGAQFSRSIRIQIPRLLVATYELRNNRAIGHVGGDVDPNHMDAEFFLRSAKWMIAELVRSFTTLSVAEASALIESITEKILPAVWEVSDRKRVLNTSLSSKDKALVLAYASPDGVQSRQICDWIRYSNLSRLRSQVLKALCDEGFIDFDVTSDIVRISPTGSRSVEARGLLNIS